jgi:hypothetical protein
MIYFTPISWGMMFLTTWHTTVNPTLEAWGLHVPTWLAVLIGASVVIITGVLEWKYSMPSYFRSLNKQVYKEDNPVIERLKRIEQTLKRIEEKKND